MRLKDIGLAKLIPLFLLVTTTAKAALPLKDPFPDFGSVVNGRPPQPRSPFEKSTVLIRSDSGFCSGTLIARDLVVTAGHCVTQTNTNNAVDVSSFVIDFSTYYNGKDFLPRRTSLRARALRLHPNYDHAQIEKESQPFDLAMIRLAAAAPTTHRPADILPGSLRLREGDQVVAAGFGNRNFRDQSPDYRLLTFEYRVSDVSDDHSLVTLSATRFGGIGSGDSGGPAWVRKNGKVFFWGIASSSEEEGMAEAAFENFLAHKQWVENAAWSMGVSLKLP